MKESDYPLFRKWLLVSVFIWGAPLAPVLYFWTGPGQQALAQHPLLVLGLLGLAGLGFWANTQCRPLFGHMIADPRLWTDHVCCLLALINIGEALAVLALLLWMRPYGGTY